MAFEAVIPTVMKTGIRGLQSLGAKEALLLTLTSTTLKSVGSVARMIEAKQHPDKFQLPFKATVQREANLLLVTAVSTFLVQLLTARVSNNLFFKFAMTIPGLILAEWWSRKEAYDDLDDIEQPMKALQTENPFSKTATIAAPAGLNIDFDDDDLHGDADETVHSPSTLQTLRHSLSSLNPFASGGAHQPTQHFTSLPASSAVRLQSLTSPSSALNTVSLRTGSILNTMSAAPTLQAFPETGKMVALQGRSPSSPQQPLQHVQVSRTQLPLHHTAVYQNFNANLNPMRI